MIPRAVITIVTVVTAVGAVVILVLAAPQASSNPEDDRSLFMEAAPEAEAILADGVVTRAEYDAAMAATIACARAEGVLVTEPRFDGWRYDYRVITSDDNDRQPSRAFDRCYGEHLRAVDQAWAEQIAAAVDPSTIYPRWADCMRRQGFTIDADADPGKVIVALDAESPEISLRCSAEADPRITLPEPLDYDRVFARYRACMEERGLGDALPAVIDDDAVRTLTELSPDDSALCLNQAEIDERVGMPGP